MLLLEIITRNSLWSTACQKQCWNVLSTVSPFILRSLHTWLLTSRKKTWTGINSTLLQSSPCCNAYCKQAPGSAGPAVDLSALYPILVQGVFAISPKQCASQVATGQLSEFSICWDAYRPEWWARPLKLEVEMIKKQKQNCKSSFKIQKHRSLGTSWRLPPMNLHLLSCTVSEFAKNAPWNNKVSQTRMKMSVAPGSSLNPRAAGQAPGAGQQGFSIQRVCPKDCCEAHVSYNWDDLRTFAPTTTLPQISRCKGGTTSTLLYARNSSTKRDSTNWSFHVISCHFRPEAASLTQVFKT